MNTLLPGAAVRSVLASPLLRPAVMRLRRAQFLSNVGNGLCYGVFDSFEAARAWLPRTPEFNVASLADEHMQVRLKHVFEYDYPVMWALEHALMQGATRILDIGGSVGVHYYAYAAYLEMPPGLDWQIVEVPTMVALGRALGQRNEASALRFTDNLNEALREEHDIWLSAGALQYLEDARPNRLLEQTTTTPRYIVLNKLPLYEGEDFVTTQNIGDGSFAPFHVYNRSRLVRDIEAAGYRLKDQWPVHERSLDLPGFPERSFPTFSGLCFESN